LQKQSINRKGTPVDNRNIFLATSTTADRHFLAHGIVERSMTDLAKMLLDAVVAFLLRPITPESLRDFERKLQEVLRSTGRFVVEQTINCLEPEDAAEMPHDIINQGLGYRRLTEKTQNQNVLSLFGTVTLWRRGYRHWHRDINESVCFPLELSLGLVQGITPALGDVIGKQLASAGASENSVIEYLRDSHNVAIGKGRFRKFVDQLSAGLEEHQLAVLVEALHEALGKASKSSGNRKPVISVGRDGITLCNYKHRFYEVATTATIAVFDRSGKRLFTGYLAHVPEADQVTMSAMLKQVINALLTKWEGPLPQLAYVADSGGNESSFFEETLKRMNHPITGKRLSWQRVVDYYHVAERIWLLAEILFGTGTREGICWAKSMLKKLLKPNGASRVLHSCGAILSQRKLSASAQKLYDRACNYIRKRTKYMDYAQYKASHIPRGSGITEAACKTVFTQRLKLSGMRWTAAGAKRILILRTCLLSGIWQATYDRYLDTLKSNLPATYERFRHSSTKIAA
jgi:hypothetical protein